MSKWRPTPLNCIYVIADIHGNIDCLNQICDRILPLRKSDGGNDRLIFLGDYIDRNIDSHKVIDKLIEIKKEFGSYVKFLMGNHELLLLKAFNLQPNRDHTLQSQNGAFSVWIHNGGMATIMGYMQRAGIKDAPLYVEKFRALSYFPKEHIEFFQSLEPYYEHENYLFVHGGLELDKPVSEQDIEVLTWDRSLLRHVLELIKEGKEASWEKVIVTGHNVQVNKRAVVHEKFLMLDVSPKQLLVVELGSMEAFLAVPEQSRLVKYELKETGQVIIPESKFFKRVE